MKRTIAVAASLLLLAGCGSSDEGSGGAPNPDNVETGDSVKPPANPMPIIQRLPDCVGDAVTPGAGIPDQRWADCYGPGDYKVRVRTYNRDVTPEDIGTVEQDEVVLVLGDNRTIVSSHGTPDADLLKITYSDGKQQPVTP